MTPLQFEPGSQYQYSNAGINTAGRIIEVVSGMPYEEFLDRRLFEPLGMKDTTFWPSEEQLSRLAKSYKPGADKTGLEETTVAQLKYPLNDRKRQPMPAGGLFSTAADVAKFCQMILNGGHRRRDAYLSEDAVEADDQQADRRGDQGRLRPGLVHRRQTFGHGGAYATNMTIDPSAGLISVFLVQHAGFPGNGWRRSLPRIHEGGGGGVRRRTSR